MNDTHITPIYTRSFKLLGYIVSTSDGSFFVQRKYVRVGACVNYGLNRKYMVEAGL